ncbi:MAG: hypothetical protein ACPG6V_10360 [Flavobacteriales bacterium]
MIKQLILIVFLLVVVKGCKSKNEPADVIVVMQSKMELNTTNSIKILFKNRELGDSVIIHQEPGLKFNDNPNLMNLKHEINGLEYLEYYNYIIPTQIGEITLPKIECISTGKILTVPPKKIKVYDKLPVPTKADVFIEMTTNAKTYSVSDKILFSIYEYSKYYNVTKRTVEKDSLLKIPHVKVEKNTLNLILQSNLYKITGNKHLEAYLKKNFTILDYDYDIFRNENSMVKKDGEWFIKTKLLSLAMKPKHSGRFKFDPCRFIYVLHTSETEYFNVGTAKNETNKLLISSNRHEFEVVE